MQLIHLVRRYGDTPSETEALDIATKRERVLVRIQEHTNLVATLFPLLNIDDLVFVRPPTSDCHCDGGICQHSSSSTPSHKPSDGTEDGDGTPPELLDIAMPSTVRKLPSVWKTLPQRELELRIAQAYESLHKIRVEVGHKSFLFRSNIRLAREKKERLRGYAGVRSANRVINLFRGHYDIARWSIIRLKAPASITSKLKVLLPHHVRALPAIYDHKVRGERNKPAPWIWGIDVAGDAMAEPYLEECEWCIWIFLCVHDWTLLIYSAPG